MISDELREAARAEIDARLAQGFADRETIVADTLERLGDDLDSDATYAALEAAMPAIYETCGHGAMPAERDAAVARGAPARGYAFYHVQDTEAAAEGHGVALAYDAFGGGKAATLAIAAEVVEVLRAHGLAPAWNGKASQRVIVPMTWRRRTRPARWTEG